MKLIRYLLDFFHINGAGVQSVKYAKDHAYPATDETCAHASAGLAEVVSEAEATDFTAPNTDKTTSTSSPDEKTSEDTAAASTPAPGAEPATLASSNAAPAATQG